jgi:DNA invertase Pin-like site-specific DNA recombinase
MGRITVARIFAYCRVSTPDQTTDNQIREIESAGFTVDARHHRCGQHLFGEPFFDGQ